jgi:hypothetical protein
MAFTTKGLAAGFMLRSSYPFELKKLNIEASMAFTTKG